jgi:TonB-linked SusC/RagA family outer membrane protein
MRIIAAIFIIFLIHVSSSADAQATFDCHEKNITLRKIIDIIRQQTGYFCFFQNESRLMDRKVSVDVHKMTVENFLKVYFGVGSGDYTLEGKTYVIKRKNRMTSGLFRDPVTDTLMYVRGRITDMKGDPLTGVNIIIEGTKEMTSTDSSGDFGLRVDPDAVLLCRHVSMDPLRVEIAGRGSIHLRMKEKPAELQHYNVVAPVSNGYQRIPKERATGSFGYIDRPLINRSVSTSVTDRIENIIPGMLSNHGQSSDGTPIREKFLVRGRSTLYANAAPLIVLDNFPYDGDLDNINPNDIESISVLKDGAAASIWGVRASNGVIVVNTRRGKVDDSTGSFRTLRPVFSYTSSVTFQSKPDLYNVSNISSADFIDWEKDLYGRGYYTPGNTTPFTPVVEMLTQGQNDGIEAMKGQDIRKDLSKYLYRGSVIQQHFIQASASTENAGYYLSAGWDHNAFGLRGSSYDRVSLRLQNTLRISAPLYIDAGVNFIHTISRSDGNPGYNYRSTHANKGFYPYSRLADAQGHPLPLSLDYGSDYLQAASQLGFPDWSYVPLRDRQASEHTNKLHDLLINLGGHYTLSPSLNLEVKYQFQNGRTGMSNLYGGDAYYSRDLINRYVQVDPVTHALSYPIPQGGIQDLSNLETIAHQGRLQVNYNHTWSHRNMLTAIAGYEIRSLVTTGHSGRQYGYNPENGSFNDAIDYDSSYIGWQMFTPAPIPGHGPSTKLVDHFISYYANASYTYHNLYTLSASAREDVANLFGVKTNQKGVPLWSAGIAWQINNESFYHLAALPFLKLRATYGRSGNISRLASAYTTATYARGGITGTPYNIGYIQGLPNPNLRWEQVGTLSVGLDFASRKRFISGSVEYYRKNATDLMAPAAGDPTLGLVQNPGVPGFYYGNTASMRGSGIDLQLETHNLNGKIKWTTNFIFSRAVSNVKRYLLPVDAGKKYLDPNVISPREGQPLYAIYSFRWMGLDPATGDPMGYYNGKASKDWTSIYNNTSVNDMIYNGPSQPTIFGAMRNTFHWRSFTASCNISYKLGYYFRRPSISYTRLFNTWAGHGDYALRWQHEGDERSTNVPSIGYPGSDFRDLFYINSTPLVERADHIRLEDIQLSYDFDKTQHAWLPFGNLRLYGYVSNLGLLWKANHSGIDPYYINIPKEGRRYSVGVNVNF